MYWSISRRFRAFGDWYWYADAHHPVRTRLLGGVVLALVWAATPFGGGIASRLADGAVYGAVFALMQFFLASRSWQRERRRIAYERRCEQRAWEETATGWFADPSARHLARYSIGGKWTRWVFDGDRVTLDRGAVAADFFGPNATMPRTRRARPLLLGVSGAALLGSALIVVALAFPHREAIGIISADDTHPVAAAWWAIGLLAASAGAAWVAYATRRALAVEPSPAAPGATPGRRNATFMLAFASVLAFGATAAWGTWIQDGLGIPFPLFSFAALALLVALFTATAVTSAKVVRAEHARGTILRARSVPAALRGAFVEAND